jgi:hypothetical protein
MERRDAQPESGDGGSRGLVVSAISSWIEDNLRLLSLEEDAEGYLLGRGATPDSIERLGIREWSSAESPSPSPAFNARYGPRGEALTGMLFIPLRAPSGRLIGFEARSRFEKRVTEFRTPEAEWCPVLIGAPHAAEKLWSGGSAWIVEGVFDLFAMEMVVPNTDAVVATLRAGLSYRNADFLARLCSHTVYMVYDNDEAGRRATLGWVDPQTGKYRQGALDLLKRRGVRWVTDYRYLGKDPGEVWSSGGMMKMRRIFLGEDR